MYSYIIFVLLNIICFTSTNGFPGSSGSDCNVQLKCTGPYESRMEQASNSKLKMCASLTLYQRCLDRRKSSCRSVIYYHTVKSLIPVLMREKCKNITLPESEAQILKLFNNVAKIIPLDPKPTSKPRCEATSRGNRFRNVSSTDKRYCGLFGDPHLRTFYNSKQTCVVEGAWPLIDNEFVVVQVTNVRLVDGFSATATNKVRKEDLFNFIEETYSWTNTTYTCIMNWYHAASSILAYWWKYHTVLKVLDSLSWKCCRFRSIQGKTSLLCMLISRLLILNCFVVSHLFYP